MSVWRRLQAYLLDTLYPPFCIVCHHPSDWLCPNCRHDMLEIEESARALDGHTYRVISLGAYHHPAWQALLKQLKYHRAICLRSVIGEVLPNLRQLINQEKDWRVSYVPSDPARVRERGVEHGTILADSIAEVLGDLPVVATLLRLRPTHLNSQLDSDEARAANMQHVFEAIKQAPQPTILVDDILTSGATADQAVKTLIDAGVEDIIFLVFASRRHLE